MEPTQRRQSEWHEQWSMLQDTELFLFQDWLAPLKLEDLAGKSVLEAGCGGGHHTLFLAAHAARVTAVDLNTVDLARERTKEFKNVRFQEADVAAMDLGETFDAVVCVGVIHHTDDPDKTARNLIRHAKPGGRVAFWVYSKEGNWLVENVVEPLRRAFLRHLPRPVLLRLSQAATACLYVPVYTVYVLPLPFLPYYEYFANFRRLSFGRNVLNVFDKLNAPQVQFISRERALSWRAYGDFASYEVTPYKGVSWRVGGALR
ncbi:MAG TPA: class I SAM-dependent methyltransferase [Elusimicrobiota bacterium]|jgi:SAM-dependent methyltransferase|nr:class I SAM-dependent methyltransferase [Elusimicrobiota bacterium]